ncbi:hypothetical protein GOM49_15975 [Clostridium bovifaecis]|uniref:Uncharacterized protein n=1 Tax=Clostridium bovifaecis TaxID=2184719 RepID=A0A6I6ERV6_9CLOT|nr:hypothetical protein GOM49_15975 [Clostridium bovifaecis]
MAYEIILSKPYINNDSYKNIKYYFSVVEASIVTDTVKAVRFSFKEVITALYMEERYIERDRSYNEFWVPKSVLQKSEYGYLVHSWFIREKCNLGYFVCAINFKTIIKDLLFDCIDEVQKYKGDWGSNIDSKFAVLTYNQVTDELQHILSFK